MNWKLRAVGTTISIVLMFYYYFQTISAIKNWKPLQNIKDITDCQSVYIVQIWLLSQSILWFFAVFALFFILLFPQLVKGLLCIFYFLGPLHSIWTIVSVISQFEFYFCCQKEKDGCQDFYTYQNPVNISILFCLSLLFSILITVVLITILYSTIQLILQRYMQGYFQLLAQYTHK